MPRRSRRAILRNAAAGLGAIGAGCLTPSGSDEPTTAATDTSGPPSATPEMPETTEEPSTSSPEIDERVDATPPGSPALEPGGSWPSYRFDSGNTGSNPDGQGLKDGREYWVLKAGRAATIADGTLYNTFGRDQDHTSLTYRDPATAAVESRVQLVEYGVNGPPVVENGRVFVTTFVEVFCFDGKTGEQLWRGPEMHGIDGCPTVHDGTVLVNTSGYRDTEPHLRAFDAEKGDELWRYETGHESKSTPAVGNDKVFVTSTGGLHAIELTSGEEAYVVQEAAKRWATPVVTDGTVYAGAATDAGEELVALDAADGTIRWRTSAETNDPPVATDEAVYAFTENGLVALDTSDGSVVSSSTKHARPVGLVGDVLYAAGDGTVYALDAANDLGSLWSLRTREVQVSDVIDQYVNHVTPVDGAVYVRASDGFHGIGPRDD